MITSPTSSQSILPFKSVAVALLFCVFLGPVGLLYTSFWGGVFLILTTIYMICSKFFFLTFIVWIICCMWTVKAAEKYNSKLLAKIS